MDDLVLPDVVFQIGLAPRRIDIMTSIDGVDFDSAWSRKKTIEVDGLNLADIAWLESGEKE